MYCFESFPIPHSHILHWAPITKLTCLGSLKRCKDFSRHQQEPAATLQSDSCYTALLAGTQMCRKQTLVRLSNPGEHKHSTWRHIRAGCDAQGCATPVTLERWPQGSVLWLPSPVTVNHCLLPWRGASICLHQGNHVLLSCHSFFLSFSQPGDALITNSRILWFVPKVPEIRADMGDWGGDGILRLANLRNHFISYLIPLRREEVAWMTSDLPSPEEEKRLHLLKQIIFGTNYFWNKFQYLTSHTGTEGQLLQDTQLHRGLGNCDFIKHWSQPTFMYCQEGCPAAWCCPWPQHASHSFPFTSLLCPWPTLYQSRELNQHRALQDLCHKRFFAGAVPSTSMQQDQDIGLSGNMQPGEPDHPSQQHLPAN